MERSLKVKKLHPDAVLPTKAHVGDLGYDLYALEDTVIAPGTVTKVRTGIAIGFPQGYGGIIEDRSSVATKQHIQKVAGVIDCGYTGEILVAFFNLGTPVTIVKWFNKARTLLSNWFGHDKEFTVQVYMDGAVTLRKGDKIAQLVLQKVETFPIEEFHDLGDTTRGSNGFGSTGR